MKKLMKYFLVLTLLSVVFVIPANAEENTTEFLGGDGSPGNPYVIASTAHLNNIRYYLDANFELVTDITFVDADFEEGGNYYNNGRGWEPIGSTSEPFTGKLNGNGHTIINRLYLSVHDLD